MAHGGRAPGSIASSSSSVGSMKSVFAKSACQGSRRARGPRIRWAESDPGEGVDDNVEELRLRSRRAATFSRRRSKGSSEIGVDVAPPIRVSEPGSRTTNLSLGDLPVCFPRVDDERAAFGQARVAARERMLVQLRGRRMQETCPRTDMPCGASSSRSGTIAITRPHPTPNRAIPWPVPASSVREYAENALRCDSWSSPRWSRRSCFGARRRPDRVGRPTSDEQALAERYAPVVRLAEHRAVRPRRALLPTDIDRSSTPPTSRVARAVDPTTS